MNFLLGFVYEPSSRQLEVKQRAAAQFLLPALNCAPVATFVDFFQGSIAKILHNLTRENIGSETARKEVLVARSTACQLIGELIPSLC